MRQDRRKTFRPGPPLGSVGMILLLGTMLLILAYKDLIPEGHRDAVRGSDPIYVHYLVQNQWVNGQVTNLAAVELRDGRTSGTVIDGADVLVNGERLVFDRDTQSYKGTLSEVEQWERITLDIKTRDGRTISGYVTAVFLVEFVEPGPWAEIPLSPPLPIEWEYSEKSMHTVDMEIWKDNEKPRSIEIRGNSTTIDLRQLRMDLQDDDVVHIQIHPPWTSNFEFEGYTTKRSKAQFVTTAVISVKIVEVE